MTINPDGRRQSLSALSGSREPDPSCTGSGPSGFDPERKPIAALAQVLLELRLSEGLFRQYGFQHLDKAEEARDDPREFNSRMQKAYRNTERADCCKRAMDFFEEVGGIDAFAAIRIEAGTGGTPKSGPTRSARAGAEGIARHD